jgi:DNA-binding MarR family transcriptional regulator
MSSDIQSDVLEVLKELPPLMPQFLQRRRVGLPAVDELVEELGVERPTFFTMVLLHRFQGAFGDEPLSLAQILDYNPYGTVDGFSAPLATLKEKGLVLQDQTGRFALTPRGRDAVERVHVAGRAYLSQMQPLPPDDLEMLAGRLESAVEGILADPVLAPRPGSHLAGSRSLRVFGLDAHPMVRIEQAIYDLWSARDDAHMKAWRDSGLEGPTMDVLTHIWSGEARTVGDLTESLQGLTPEDVESSLAYLVEREYVERDGDEVRLTPKGALARDDIERETDRIYFNPWPPFGLNEVAWVRDKLREINERLPGSPTSA